MKSLFVVLTTILVLGLALPVQAENPESATVKLKIPRGRNQGSRVRPLRFRVTHRFSEAVEAGGSCITTLYACISPFTPRGTRGRDGRRCTSFEVKQVAIPAGSNLVRFITSSRPMKRRGFGSTARGKQVTFQTGSECTDAGSNTETIYSTRRAKKVSRNDGKGVTSRKFRNALTRNTRAFVIQ